jgi:protoheme IX farnesyltransferase
MAAGVQCLIRARCEKVFVTAVDQGARVDARVDGLAVRRHRSVAATVRAYVALTKPRIIELLLVTTLPVMFLAAGGFPPLRVALATIVGGTLAAGSANALNCWIDRDIDEQMRRTRRRPLAQHTVSPREAAVFGVLLGVVATVWLGVTVNWLSAGLALAANLFYVLVYSMVLKRRTAQNIVWGGAAGCFPTLIGWTAVTGSLAWPPVVLFLVVFFWTPPHFWALALRYRDDYVAAKVPMLPVVAPESKVVREIVAYSWVMVLTSLVLWPVAGTGWLYAGAAGLLGAAFLAQAHQMWRRVRAGRTGAALAPMRLFHWSNTYLALLFVSVAIDALLF